MKRGVKTIGVALCVAVVLLPESTARGEALEALLARTIEKHGVDVALPEDLDLSLEVNGACLNDPEVFGVAYRVVEKVHGSPSLTGPLWILLLDKATGTWAHQEVPLKGIRIERGICHDASGSPTDFLRSPSFYYAVLHRTPSSCATLVLTKDLAVRTALCGWIVAISPKEKVLYHESLVHFAPTHPAELSVYDPHSGAHPKLFPWRTLGPIRRAYVEELRRAYEAIGDDWFRFRNHHGDPERTDCSLAHAKGPLIAIDDRTDSIAFILKFQDRATAEAKPTEILVLYRNVLSEAETTYEEFALEDLRAHFEGASDREVLEAFVTPQLR